jgi:prepilin-type N-terminal cleavage/methylation domain-containing protein
MRNPKAFTLVELLVVISIIALLVAILMPSLNKAKEIAYRMKCSTNVAAIGKALITYRSMNDDYVPILYGQYTWDVMSWGSINNTAVYTGYRREEPPSNKQPYCITALLYLLVRGDANPKLFVCPSDSVAKPQPDAAVKYHDATLDEDVYAWDFSEADNVSYSYQSCRQDITRWQPELPILADKTPVYTLGPSITYQVGWSDTISDTDRLLNMSQNHKGEEINVLRANGAVNREKRADVNTLMNPKDCIYTWLASPAGARSSTQLDADAQPKDVYANTTMTYGTRDSFIHGPYAKK